MKKYLNLTEEQLKLSSKNNKLAWKFFGYKCNNHKGLVLHHKDETLRHTDIERYIEWRPEDLEVMTKEEHVSYHHKGKHLSEDTKKKLSENHKGMVFSDEHKKNISKACKGVSKSEETKLKMSESHIGKKCKKVECLDTEIVFNSIKEASNITGVPSTKIINCCKGRCETANNLRWRYVNA